MSPHHRTSFVFMFIAALAAMAVGCATGWIVAMYDPSAPLTSLKAGGGAFCLIFFGSAGWAAVFRSSDSNGQSQPQPPDAGQAPPDSPRAPIA